MTIAKAGEKVTCENGHHICTVGRDVEAGGVQKPEDFVDWKHPEPELAATFPIKCTVCGAPWITPEAICIGGEWRQL